MRISCTERKLEGKHAILHDVYDKFFTHCNKTHATCSNGLAHSQRPGKGAVELLGVSHLSCKGTSILFEC